MPEVIVGSSVDIIVETSQPQSNIEVTSSVGKGAKGDAATVTAGIATGLPQGEHPTVENVGTTSDAVFNFGIPTGPTGPEGPQGETAVYFGDDAPAETDVIWVDTNDDPVVVVPNGMGVIIHGAVAGTARGTDFTYYTWIGSVEPTNALTNDIWVYQP